jgi:hypothetical protein
MKKRTRKQVVQATARLMKSTANNIACDKDDEEAKEDEDITPKERMLD